MGTVQAKKKNKADRFFRRAAKKLAPLKVLAQRQRAYLSWIQFIMIAALFFSEKEFSLYYLLLIPLGIIWVWFDKEYIIEEELDFLQRRSRILKELLDK